MPHPLDGPRWKVRLASEHIEALSHDSQAFFNRYIGRARLDLNRYNREASGHLLEPLVEVETPRHWPVSVGEVAYDLRSALDQLICQLAIRAEPGRGPRFCQSHRTSFPIYRFGPRSRSKRKAMRFFTDRVSYLLPADRRRVEAAQPYKRGNGGAQSPLWRLAELNNTDKHNIVVITDEYFLIGPGRIRLVGSAETGPVISPGVELESDPPHQIAFGEGCDAVKGLPVVQTLRQMARSVSSVVETFAADLEELG